ncbi:WD40-repeat-containing domain protein [Suillus ampliporus]|nr:WD40-repeat-containing domain protein [Suillus ampliporus]
MSSPASVQCPITSLTPTAFKGHTDTVSCMDFFPDNRHLVTGSQDMSIRLWDIHTGLQIGSPWLGHSSWLNELAVSPDGSRVASCAYDQVVQIWSREGSVLAGPWKCSGPVMSVSWSPDGHHLACGLSGGNLEIRSAGDASDNIIMSISTENDCIWSVAYSPDGTRLATSGKNGSLAVWDRSTGEKQLDLQKHVGNVNSVCWSADGTRLISAGDDRSICIWHSNTGSLISVIVGHTEAVRGVVASPDGRIFASASWDGSLRLWSSTTFELIDKPIVHDKALYAVAVSRDSVRVAFGGGSNGSVFVLDVAGDNDIPTENEIPPDARIEGDSAESLSTLHSDSALGEDTESTSIPPSVMDDIDKSIALSRRGNHEAAMQAIDLGFIDANGNADMIRFLMLIKSIIIFSTGRQDEGMARVLDLVDTRPGHDAPMCRTVQAYMYAQQGMGAVNENDYDKAITMFANAMTLGPFDPLFSRLQTISLIFEWKFDSLWRLIHQQKCEALRAAGRLNETTELLYDTMHKFDDGTNTDTEFVEWLTDFKRECVAASVIEGDAALRTENYDKATNWYSAAIALDPLRDDCFLNRSKARAAQGLWDGALEDAQQAIGLDPSSPWGFEMKHAALHALRDYDNAIMAFRTMLSKLDHAGDPKTRELRQKYVSPSDTKRAIQKAVFAELANAPLRLFNTNTGLLCDREAQIRTFETSQEFKELVSSITTLAASQADRIRAGVNKFFQYVMLSHRWEGKEPLLPDIQDKNVYTLDPVHTIIKLQKFCETARGRGYRWAWSDTCCIDKINNVELQKSLISMFLWYRNAALTITYLSDVSGSSTSGGLAESAWRTRGWILQEFLASLVVLFFRKDWTLYGDDHHPTTRKSTLSFARWKRRQASTSMRLQTSSLDRMMPDSSCYGHPLVSRQRKRISHIHC